MRTTASLKTTARGSTYAGVFLVALANLMYELLLTRIFSVTMWYHFAFMAISMAMLGMSAGALAIFLFPRYFPEEKTHRQLSQTALAFSLSIVISLGLHLNMSTASGESLPDPVTFLSSFGIVAVPFIFGGMCITLALSRFIKDVSAVYAADLLGAALGCVLLWVMLNLTDGPTAVIGTACLASAAAICFAVGAKEKRAVSIAIAGTVLILAACSVQSLGHGSPILRIAYAKGRPEADAIYEKWNSFSRVTVYGDANIPGRPFGWGFSRESPFRRVRQLHLLIDATAGTVLTGFDGDLGSLDYLKYDVTNIAHYIRPQSKVLVVGTGGGRDVLSALAFGQPLIRGIDINYNIIDTVNQRFGDFTGHLDRRAGVSFINDDARSYLERSSDRFDIIQISVIDTWAATSAGAFVLTENSLYTVEGWVLFIQRLRPHGILSVSRFYSDDFPGETYRLTALASAALSRLGIVETRKHIAIVDRPGGESWGGPYGVATLLLSNDKLSDRDLDQLETRVRDLQFEMLLSPRARKSGLLASLATSAEPVPASAAPGLDLSPPTDDRPFFFQMVRLRDALMHASERTQRREVNNTAVRFLALSFVEVVGMSVLFILLPLLLRARNAGVKQAGRPVLYFASIGLGFMLVEVSQLQRLNIFLGHPTYSLSVVLFALLFCSGLGSWATKYLESPSSRLSRAAILLGLLAVLLCFGLATPAVLQFFKASVTPVRIAVAIAILAPVGLLMGTAFPLGMQWASKRNGALTPWLWGINGATSVCGSVLAVMIALYAGISGSFWVGVACYGLAFAALRVEARRVEAPAPG
ncbi:MAG TPA: hypothetical protein VKB87_21710 [Myxococcaceae bacterium]|nr:hypothetical protein [Myxococcaceae bacterium]